MGFLDCDRDACDPALFHMYLDTDANASTGYQPPSRKPGELGADYLVEGAAHCTSGTVAKIMRRGSGNLSTL